MKNSVLILSTLLIILSSSCSVFKNSTERIEEKLIGKWYFINVKITNIPKNEANELQDDINKNIKSGYILFSKDKTCVFKTFDGTKQGTWEVTNKGASIIMRKISTIDEIYTIKQLDANNLRLINNSNLFGTTISIELFLTKEK